MDRHTDDRAVPPAGLPADDASEALTMAPDAGGTMPAPAGERNGLLAPGQRFGPYMVHRLLGRGGMGEVYEAEERASGRRVALKLFNRPIDNQVERDRFLREGQLAASISHPNSVYIFGTDEIQGMPVIAMELASAGTLKDAVSTRGPLPPAEAVDAILQVINGLEAAAAVGILHRDVKPANCFVDRDGTVKVGDFGLSISTLARDETHLTMAGTILGTPAFASPEQMRGDALDVRADIYSVGATLYYLVTGRAPFEEPNVVKLVGQVLTDVPPSPRSIKPAVPRGLAAVAMRCLRKSPTDRPQTYAALRKALLPFASLAPTPATLGLRFLAGLVDALIVTLASLPHLIEALRAMSSGSVPDVGWWGTFGDLPITVAYFAILEGLWGRSIGKALFGLRVVDAGRHAPGLRRASLRASVFALLDKGPSLAFILAFGGPAAYLAATIEPGAPGWLSFAQTGLIVISVGVLFSTARRSNGFAGLHDLLSGTRVVSKAAAVAGLAARTAGQPVVAPSDSRVIGPYRAVDDAPGPGTSAVVAYDQSLHRNVWIYSRPPGTEILTAVRRDLARTGRLRWITGVRTPTDCWDAFEAVAGRSFATAIERPQPWRVVRMWLRDLADEIDAASKDGTIPALAVDAVWVGSDGHVRLLDSLGAAGSAGAAAIQDFLLTTVCSALSGRLAESVDEARALPTGPVPLPARRMLDDLAARRFTSSRAVADAVDGLLSGRVDVPRGLRAGHLALAGLLPVLMIPVAFIVGAEQWRNAEPNAWLETLARSAKAGNDGLSPEAREAVDVYVASVLPSDARGIDTRYEPIIERVRRAHPDVTAEERQAAESALSRLGIDRAAIVAREKREVAFIASFIPWSVWLCLAAISLLSAAIARGGLCLSAFGIAVVRKDGGTASRFRCLVRALVAWSPVIAGAPLGIGFLVLGAFTRTLDASQTADHVLVALGVTSAVAVVAAFVAGAIRAALRPERGWQDQIAGTCLVPK